MLFKQVKLYQLETPLSYDPSTLEDQLEAIRFRPCLPTLPISVGLIPPIDQDDAPLVHASNGYMMFCLQIEEKILPVSVVNRVLAEKIKAIEQQQDRKVSSKERANLKDEVTFTLLPRAFSKYAKVFAYFDIKNNWLVVDSATSKVLEMLIDKLKPILPTRLIPITIEKPATTMTHWLTHNSIPDGFFIGEAAVLQDPNKQSRIIRAQNQDLFAHTMQALIKDRCEIVQLALKWRDQVYFNLNADISLRTINFTSQVNNAENTNSGETLQDKFDTDFFIMTATLAQLLPELIKALSANQAQKVQTPETA